MKDDKRKTYKPRTKRRYPLVKSPKLTIRHKGLENAKIMGEKLREIAKEYPAVWTEKNGYIRYNTIYGHMMRFRIKKTVMSVECKYKNRWKRVSSYSLVQMDLDQWRKALEYISATYE